MVCEYAKRSSAQLITNREKTKKEEMKNVFGTFVIG